MLGPVTLAVEGATDAAVARRLLGEVGLQPGPEYVKNGKAALDLSLVGYNYAARHSCWLVLRDLDHDAACAPELRRVLLPDPAPHMRLHIPVRAIEAWLLADAETISRSLSVPRKIVPQNPETLTHPKRALLDLARRSRKKFVRDALLPEPGTSASVGPGYSAFLIEFATRYWRPAAAAERSESLARLMSVLRRVSEHRDDRAC